jgi:hypothetical protein
MRLYVASSWRNASQPSVVEALCAAGHEVYDFRNPPHGRGGFAWSDIDPAWESWTTEEYRTALDHPIAQAGFGSDYEAMKWADGGVLVMPSGRSAHIEAGYFNGACKPLFILLSQAEPELMYKMATAVVLDIPELVAAIATVAKTPASASGEDINAVRRRLYRGAHRYSQSVLGSAYYDEAMRSCDELEDAARAFTLATAVEAAPEFSCDNCGHPLAEHARSTLIPTCPAGGEERDTLVRVACGLADHAPWRQSPDMDMLKSVVAEYRVALRRSTSGKE